MRLWDNAWQEFIPFLDYDAEIRTVLCSTNAIESLNARYRRAVKARGHFPTEQAALKCLYLVTRSLDPTGVGRTRWTMRWKPASTRSPSPSATGSPPPKPANEPPETPLARQTRCGRTSQKAGTTIVSAMTADVAGAPLPEYSLADSDLGWSDAGEGSPTTAARGEREAP